MIKIICLGKLKEKYLTELVNDYLHRIKKYHNIEIIELQDIEDLKIEGQNILKHINQTDYVITLEIEGKMLSSEELATTIDKTFINYSTITFVIGSSTGLDKSVKERSNLALSFSKFTYPHGLFRGILLEQIYRTFKINNHEKYHK